MNDEKSYYPIVKNWLEEQLKKRFGWCYLEITANRRFSDQIKAHIQQGHDIVFQFLKQTAPDITGFVDKLQGSGFVVADVKITTITLADVYQVKRYAELFGARYALLLSTKAIPEEFKRLHDINPVVFSTLTGHGRVTLGSFRVQNGKFVANWPIQRPNFERTTAQRILGV